MSESAPDSLAVGMIVHDRYRVMQVVGRGGLGSVYQVSDVLFSHQNVYALKELADQSSGARKQFEMESQWLKNLNHTSIPKARESFEWQGRLYLVMDFIDGENLEQKLLRNGERPLPERETLGWIFPICDALEYLHTRTPPILHRDVKPANIVVTPTGHPVLVDLGIAKEHLPGAGMTVTFVRKAGTEGYAPPEQYITAGKTGPWSDVYGLAATLYQLLTGIVPPTAVERVALDMPLRRPRDFNSQISPHVDAALMRGLSLRPPGRYQSVREFALALAGAAPARATFGAPVTPATPSWPSQPTAAPSNPLPARGPQAPAEPTGAPIPRRGAAGPPLPPLAARPPAEPSTGPTGQAQAFGGIWTREELGARRSPGDSLSGPLAAVSSGPLTSGPLSSPDRAAARPGQPGRRSLPRGPLHDPPDEPDERQEARRPLWRSPVALVCAALVALLLIASIATVAFLRASAPPDQSTPRAVVQGYFDALARQDYGRAWQYTADSHNDLSSRANDVAGYQSDTDRYGVVQSAQIISVDTDGATQATARVSVVRARAPTTPLSYTLSLTQYDGNVWLISNIATT